MNTMGYIVEVDAYDKTAGPQAHRAGPLRARERGVLQARGGPAAGRLHGRRRAQRVHLQVRLHGQWNAADANPADRMATGDKYLDAGKLYVAKFNADGTGQWLELSMANPAIAGYASYAFADQADVMRQRRLAADAVGATKMDRPSGARCIPGTGEVYFTLTNNSNRRCRHRSSQVAPTRQPARLHRHQGHARSAGPATPTATSSACAKRATTAAATAFTWDVYLFGAESSAALGQPVRPDRRPGLLQPDGLASRPRPASAGSRPTTAPTPTSPTA
jgi:hypothetical protein